MNHDHICLQCLLNPAVRSVARRRAAPLIAALGLGSKRGDDNNDDNDDNDNGEDFKYYPVHTCSSQRSWQ